MRSSSCSHVMDRPRARRAYGWRGRDHDRSGAAASLAPARCRAVEAGLAHHADGRIISVATSQCHRLNCHDILSVSGLRADHREFTASARHWLPRFFYGCTMNLVPRGPAMDIRRLTLNRNHAYGEKYHDH